MYICIYIYIYIYIPNPNPNLYIGELITSQRSGSPQTGQTVAGFYVDVCMYICMYKYIYIYIYIYTYICTYLNIFIYIYSYSLGRRNLKKFIQIIKIFRGDLLVMKKYSEKVFMIEMKVLIAFIYPRFLMKIFIMIIQMWILERLWT
jgi:hypothetical protein